MPEDPIDKRGKSHDAGRNRALRAIAVFKLAKAALLFAAGIGLLRLLHPDFFQRLTHWARSLAWSYDRGFLQSALGKLTGLDSRQLKALGAGAFLYAILFATEGIGLWFSRRWAEYLGPQQVEQWRATGAMQVFHYAQNLMCPLSYGLLEDARRYEPWPDFPQPALIFHGAHDEVVPASFSRRFAAGHPNRQVEILDSGHELLNVLDYLGHRIPEFLA